MNYTTNYDLPQWQPNDITSWMGEDGLNGAFSKIDTAMSNNESAASGAQSTASLAITQIQTINQNIATINQLPINLTSQITLNKLPGSNNTYWTYDRNRKMLYINGMVAYPNYPASMGNIIFTTPIKPSSDRTVIAGALDLLYQNGHFTVADYAPVIFRTNGNVEIESSSDFVGQNMRIWMSLALNVQEWGLVL